MSHEVRTPLTALLGFSDLMFEVGIDESVRRQYGHIILRNGQHLLSVIDDILDLTKIEAGKLEVERLVCSLIEVLADVVSLMRARAKARGLALNVKFQSDVPERIVSDPTRLRQILFNLVGNAIKFTSSGSVSITLHYAAQPSMLSIDVIDTGIGMTPEQVAHVFTPFFQGTASTTRQFGGSGLGLAISKSLASALGAELEVQSSEGQGSVFAFRLPSEVPPGTPMVRSLTIAPEATSLEAAAALVLSGSVLLAEDGPDNQLLLRAILERAGLDVTVAENGRLAVDEALAAVNRGAEFDLILMDMEMPELDGYGATRELRARGYGGPVVALTAHAMAGQRERCLQAGCNDFISKPVERRRLLSSLSRYFRVTPLHDGPELRSEFADDAEMAPIIAQFVAALPTRIHALRAEQGVAGSAILQRLVHQLKGAAGGYGFPAISTAAANVEQVLVANGSPDELASALDELYALCGRVRAPRPVPQVDPRRST